MCKVSKKTILNANARMKNYKIGQGSGECRSEGFIVATSIHGKTYSHTFTEEKVNAMFARALSKMESRYGKAL